MKKINISIAAFIGIVAIVSSACEEKNVVPALRLANAAETFSANGDIKKNALSRTALYENLKNISSVTLLLPSEDAFKKAGYFSIESVSEADVTSLNDIVLYHAMEGASFLSDFSVGTKSTLSGGKSITINIGSLDLSPTGVVISGIGNSNGAASVEQADVDIANGVVHTLNRLLLPVPRDLADIVAQNGEFELLEAALVHANLLTTLGGTIPFTLFAPRDAAFISYLGIAQKNADGTDRDKADIMADAVAAINALPVPDLTDILTYHVANGNSTLAQLVDVNSLTMLNGDDIAIDKIDNKDGTFTLKGFKGTNNAATSTVLQGDVVGTNGILHAIDEVLKP
jgi:uncharacterized surface protein with fasciclin (FAS1) repeats